MHDWAYGKAGSLTGDIFFFFFLGGGVRWSVFHYFQTLEIYVDLFREVIVLQYKIFPKLSRPSILTLLMVVKLKKFSLLARI